MSAWQWPQWVMAGILVFGVIVNVSNHGKPHKPYDGPTSAIAGALVAWLLWCGGFWQ